MSSALMSCVRENSPPLEMAETSSAALSLSESIPGSPVYTGTIPNTPSTDHQKRRRFHPLRNLRRIFRRRTVISAVGTPPSSLSEHNLQDSIIEPPLTTSLPASSPSSPQQHKSDQSDSIQFLSTTDQDADNSVNDNEIPALANNSIVYQHYQYQQQQQHHHNQNKQISPPEDSSSSMATRQSIGFAVLPNAFNNRTSSASSSSFYLPKEKLISVSDSTTQELSTGIGFKLNGDCETNSGDIRCAEMTGSQRSLNEGRIMDGDLNREALSQSHDSVFLEPTSASSLSIVLKAELTDVLRKRRNRASDESLTLPGNSPKRDLYYHNQNGCGQQQNSNTSISNVSVMISGNLSEDSLSQLSLTNTEIIENDAANYTAIAANSTLISAGDYLSNFSTNYEQTTTTANKTCQLSNRYSSNATQSYTTTIDEIDLFSSNWQRLSHSAARHKMAIRPKNKGPTRYRRTFESSILPSTPEMTEDVTKLSAKGSDTKVKSLSLPVAINIKDIEKLSNEDSDELKAPSIINTKRPKIEKDSSEIIAETSKSIRIKSSGLDTTLKNTQTNETEADDSNFLRRLIHRSSKRMEGKINSNNDHQVSNDEKKTALTSQKLLTNRNYASSGDSRLGATRLSAADNKMKMTTNMEQNMPPNVVSGKPKSGPAARQRYIPKDLSLMPPPPPTSTTNDPNSILSSIKWNKQIAASENCENTKINQLKENRTTKTKLSNSLNEETFKSTSLIRDITWNRENVFEKNAQSSGTNGIFQQKICKSNESFNFKNGLSEVVLFTGFDSKPQRKFVEKSKSFRDYSENNDKHDNCVFNNSISGNKINKNNNTPSLPNINFKGHSSSSALLASNSFKKMEEYGDDEESSGMSSLGFEINDNNLVKCNKLLKTTTTTTTNTTTTTPTPTSIFDTRNLITSVPAATATEPTTNISEIENNIDLLVKSPFVSVLRNSTIFNSDEIIKCPSLIENTNNNNINNSSKLSKSSINVNKENQEENSNKILEHDHQASRGKSIERKFNKIDVNSNGNADDDYDDDDDNENDSNKVELRKKSQPFETTKTTKTISTIKTNSNSNSNSNSFGNTKLNNMNRARRSSSVTETLSTMKSPDIQQNNGIPEFLKIQLNRVNPMQSKINVVLSKNAKDNNQSILATKNSFNLITDDDSRRRFSNENIEITEESSDLLGGVGGGGRGAGKRQTNIDNQNLMRLPTQATKTATISNTIQNNPNDKCDKRNNNLTLNERRKLFLSCDGTKINRGGLDDFKNDRKKFSYDGMHKSAIPLKLTAAVTPKTPTTENPIENPPSSVVVMRKKSFGPMIANNDINNTNDSSNTIAASNKLKDDSTPELMKVFARRSLKIKDDDESVAVVVATATTGGGTTSTLTKTFISNGNVDSDKENQSSSEEKLDRLSTFEETVQQQQQEFNNNINCDQFIIHNNSSSSSVIGITTTTTTTNNKNRNSLADFRQKNQNSIQDSFNDTGCGSGGGSGGAVIGNLLSQNNNNNNNNNNNKNNNNSIIGNYGNHQSSNVSENKIFSPSSTIRLNNGLRNVNSMNGTTNSMGKGFSRMSDFGSKITNNNNSSNNNNNNMKNKASYSQTNGSKGKVLSKTIERSATVGEFIGIHQRRAEWEKRAKEALK